MNLENRRVVVTGGASGMGAGTVAGFVREGARVVSLDLTEEAGREVAVAASAEGPGKADFVVCDVSDQASVEQAFATAADLLGGLDVLVHAAGIAPAASAAEMRLDQWTRVMGVNATGTFLTNQAAFHLLQDHGGRIINFASAAGINGYPSKAHYAASKGAVVAWTRTIAAEWAPYGITANMIAPMIWTPMYDRTRASMSPDQLVAHDEVMAQRVPIGGKLGDIQQDLVPVLVFLAGEGSRFLTGQVYAVDGGGLMVR